MTTRLAITIAVVYALHFAPNVVRETYLAVAIGEEQSLRVDRFVGIHPDLFEIPGRGAYINGNPGASLLGAVPYGLAYPVLATIYRTWPALVAPKPAATYDDPRPNRTNFMNEMRARGLDVRLGVAAAVMHLGVNLPLGVLATLAMFFFLRARLGDQRPALWLALLFAFGTPVFFRSAFLNQNLILAHCTLGAFLALVWSPGHRRVAAAGACLGVGLLCDYSALPLMAAFGVWTVCLGTYERGASAGARDAGVFAAGAALPTALLFLYQYLAFGDPFLPAQMYMPVTNLSVDGWYGLQLPSSELLWRNLFDPRYGLFIFCPMLAAALAAPRYRREGGIVTTSELALILASSGALYLFSSSVAFAALQWNTGVRYLVPAVPLLFLALVPVLLHAPRWLMWTLVAPTLLISWAVSMTREGVPAALVRLATGGPELPWHTVLVKTGAAYLPDLPRRGVPLILLLLAAALLWWLWTPRRHARLFGLHSEREA